ncbi:tRNA/rRNA methyltransferase (SpoU) [Coriobacterium glomerans PW2]|uniref:tRNA/rRNA methyltransferase (SpoU) n=1 Tax=Coriobacterium glomerans (strain ATCC 49209 / DSM 20642 / JCM 10262 / PW2) TaxID=700015 RepID=F2N7P1_CORGP|nr:RNA methyltransferase [Coriobacterium glomerans]AEB06933.1 tRNA/rRNA methyltransferase (SpoU) [Coriobacterium glomerans PW2]
MRCQLVRIRELADERLDAYARLTERELRSVLEPEKGLFIAESAKVIERALEAGMEPISFLVAEDRLESLEPILALVDAAEPIPIFVAAQELLVSLTGFALTRGALAAMRRPPLPDPVEMLAGCRRVCVLDGLVDHTNVGAAFRSAAALNVDAVLVSPTCCDPLYRRAVRVSMGTVFQVPWTRLGADRASWPQDGMATLRAAGFTCAALALADESISLDDPILTAIDRLALFFGTEGRGLSDRVIEACDMIVRIPMAGGVDSLNVAAASAVVFWQLCPHATNRYRYRPSRFA